MVQTLVIVYYAVLSLVTLAAFGRDKFASSRGWWRTRESTLLWMSAAGGFIGAIVGMAAFRHKTRRLPFRVIPWVSAVVHVSAWVLVKRGW
ncbi:MAG: DUF1294 domain-containing protein [Phycisphaerae bacterium]|nr:DUF1294 domain-containing protein [Phycisphaerae bacterium]